MFSNILVFLEKPQDHGLIPFAVSLAQNANASLTLLAHTRLNAVDPIEWQLSKIEAEIELDNLVESLQDKDIAVRGGLLDCSEQTPLAQALARQVIETGADLLVLGESSRQLLLDPLLASTGITVSVLPTAQEQPPQIRKMMVPLDCSLRAECVLPIARQFSEMLQARLLLTHIVGCTDMPPRLEHDTRISSLMDQVVEYKRFEGQRYLSQVQSSLPGTSDIRLVVNNNIRASLHEIADQEAVDMVVLSAHGLSGNTLWPYGSVTHSFITNSTLPLLIIQDTGTENTNLQTWAADIPVATRPNHVA